jgi:hypothetical protein
MPDEWIDKHSVNCYFCGKLVDERDCVPADPYNNNDGGDICPECLNKKGRYNMDNYDPYKEHPYAEHWTGSVKDLVQKIAYSDARYSAIDVKSGAHVRLNLDDEVLMHIESPDGENLYDAYSQKEARHILSRLRKHLPVY